MKKVFALISSLLLCMILLSACAPTTVPEAAITQSRPWIASRYFKSEKCTYDVTRYATYADGSSEAVSTSGILTYTLTKISDAEFSLVMDFTITYGTSELLEENYIGKTDSVWSEARFDNNMRAISTKKKAEIGSDPSLNYSYEADYLNADEDGKLVATYTDSNGSQKTLKFNKAYYFDNDYLYYYVRTLDKLNTSPSSFSENINVVNWYDSFLLGKLVTYPLIVSCANKSQNVKIENNDTLFGGFEASEEGQIDDAEKLVGCYDVSIIINGVKTGSVLNAAYSKCDYKCYEGSDVKYSHLIPVQYTTRETIPDRNPHYTNFTDYILSDYSIDISK